MLIAYDVWIQRLGPNRSPVGLTSVRSPPPTRQTPLASTSSRSNSSTKSLWFSTYFKYAFAAQIDVAILESRDNRRLNPNVSPRTGRNRQKATPTWKRKSSNYIRGVFFTKTHRAERTYSGQSCLLDSHMFSCIGNGQVLCSTFFLSLSSKLGVFSGVEAVGGIVKTLERHTCPLSSPEMGAHFDLRTLEAHDLVP